MSMKNIILFIVGGAAGVFSARKYYQNKYQKQYEEDRSALEEYYHRVDEYERVEHDDENDENEVNPTETDSKPGGRMTSEERAAVKEKLDKNWKGTTNYAGMYRERNGYTERQLAEGEHPLDSTDDVRCDLCRHYDYPDAICRLTEENMAESDSCSDFEADIEATPEAEVFDEHQKNKDKPPKIISAEAYSELPAHIDKKVLYLYAYDEIVVDEDNEDGPIDEPELLIGDALTKYGFIDNEERLIFVMNYAQDTCYEIQKVDASWTDTH